MDTNLTYEQFESTYKPLQNHLANNAAYDGCMFETYGHEFEHVRGVAVTNPEKVWTALDCDGELIITNGMHFVNRMGYLITEIPAPESNVITVCDEDLARELFPYRVMLHEEPGETFTLVFDCQAEDADHAAEQAEDAYPGCLVISTTLFDGESSCN